MAEIRYVFSDLRTGIILYEMPLRGVRMTTKLNDWGSLGGTFNLDQSGHINRDLLNCSLPGKCALTVERDNVPIWDGIVWGRVYHSQAKAMQLSARTREAYLDKIKIPVDFVREDYEQRNIVRELWELLQSNPDTNLTVTLPSPFSTIVPRSIEVLASDAKTFFAAISSVADGEDGMDWTISTTKSSSSTYIRTLRIGYPTLGSILPSATFDYPGNITEYYKNETMTPAGTDIYVMGAGEGPTMPIGHYQHSDLLTAGWLGYDALVSRKDLVLQNQVDDFAVRLGVVRRAPYTTFKAFVKANLDPVYGSYALGDTVGLSLIDPRHPDGLTTQARLVAMAYWPPSNEEVEKAELIFEGDELNDG